MNQTYQQCKTCLIQSCCSDICKGYIDYLSDLKITISDGVAITKEMADGYATTGNRTHPILVMQIHSHIITTGINYKGCVSNGNERDKSDD